MTFDRFMEMALYEPGLGYYAALPPRPDGQSGALADFQSSPQVHRAFGHVLARKLVRIWEALGRPNPFVIVELGAGAGELAEQILEGLVDASAVPLVEYHAVDVRREGTEEEGTADHRGDLRGSAGVSAPPLDRAGETPALPGSFRLDQVTWWGSLADLRRAGVRAHCVVSNEFFDALPVHRVAWVGGKLREIYVDWGETGFVERVDDPSNGALARWIADGEVVPPEGWRGEICLRLVPTFEAIAGLFDRGVVLTIDYGYETADLFQRTEGTLVAYHRHQWNDDVLRRVGEQDLTSHVDFGAMVRIGRRYGFEPAFLTTQRDFLLRLGLADGVDHWIARESTPGQRWQARFALAELVRPDGLGRLKVLAQQRGLPKRVEHDPI
jgi:SAM-dependent MidA family methyltransferase